MVMQRLNTGTTGKVFKLILLGVLFAAVAGLVLTDTGGFFRGGVSRQDVARVGDTHIGIVSFSQTYRRALQQNGMQDTAARQMGVPYMVLQQEMTRLTMLQAAHKNGIRINDTYVGKTLKEQLDKVEFPGITDTKEKFAVMLQQQGIDERSFVDLVRGDFAVNLFSNAPVGTNLATPEELSTALFKADKEKRVVTLVPINGSSLKNRSRLNDAALKAFYDENKERYRTSEHRDIAVLVLPTSLFATEDVKISDKEARAYYDQNKDQFKTAERVRFAQLIVADEKKAEEIADKKPNDLSTFKGEKSDYLASDWYSRNNLPKELQETIYPEKAKGLMGPVKSPLGWHILVVEEYEDSKPEAFENVKADIERQLKEQKLDEQMAAVTEKMDSFTMAGQGVDEIANEYKLTPQTVRDIAKETLGTKINELNVSDAVKERVKEAAFSQEQDEANFVETSDGQYVVVEVTNIVPSQIPAFDTVKANITKDAQEADKQKAILELADKIIGSSKANDPASFGKLITENGLKPMTLPALTLQELASQQSKEIANLAFALSANNKLSFANAADGVVLVQLQRIETSKEMPSDTQRKDLDKKVQSAMANEIGSQILQSLTKEYGAVINYDLMKAQFGETAPQ